MAFFSLFHVPTPLRFTPLSGHDLSKPIPYAKDAPIPQQIAQSFASSLRNLHADTLDAYILHGPFPRPEQTLEAWLSLARLRAEGKVRLIGISNVYDVASVRALHEASGEKVDIVQNRWYQGNGWNAEVWQYCVQNSIVFQYVRPLSWPLARY